MILLLMKVFTLHNPRRDQKAQGETSTSVRLRQQLFWTLTDSTKIYHQDSCFVQMTDFKVYRLWNMTAILYLPT